MAFTLEVAETEIENLKIQVTDTKKTIDRVSVKIDGVEQDISKTNLLLAKLDMTQNETLKAVNSIIENGGTNRCVERGLIIQQIREDIKSMQNNQCANCKHTEAIRTLNDKQKLFGSVLKWGLGLFTTVCAGVLVWYATVGHVVLKAVPK